MKNNIIKIFYILIMLTILIGGNCITTYASVSMSDVEAITRQHDSTLDGKLDNFMGNAMGFAQTVAVAVALVMLIVLATKYIMASTNERAELKQHAVVYVFGAVLLFAGVGIVELIKKFMEGM